MDAVLSNGPLSGTQFANYGAAMIMTCRDAGCPSTTAPRLLINRVLTAALRRSCAREGDSAAAALAGSSGVVLHHLSLTQSAAAASPSPSPQHPVECALCRRYRRSIEAAVEAPEFMSQPPFPFWKKMAARGEYSTIWRDFWNSHTAGDRAFSCSPCLLPTTGCEFICPFLHRDFDTEACRGCPTDWLRLVVLVPAAVIGLMCCCCCGRRLVRSLHRRSLCFVPCCRSAASMEYADNDDMMRARPGRAFVAQPARVEEEDEALGVESSVGPASCF